MCHLVTFQGVAVYKRFQTLIWIAIMPPTSSLHHTQPRNKEDFLLLIITNDTKGLSSEV